MAENTSYSDYEYSRIELFNKEEKINGKERRNWSYQAALCNP